MKNFEDILKQIKQTEDDTLAFLKKDEKYKKFKIRVWELIRKERQAELSDLKETIGDAKYDALEKMIKDDNSEYYALAYFRDKEVDPDTRKALLNKIYNYSVVVSDYTNLAKSITKLSKDQLGDIIFVLHDITDFCTEYNRTGQYLTKVLGEFYDLEEEICGDLATLYDKNAISLKLDHIINKLKKMEKKEKT